MLGFAHQNTYISTLTEPVNQTVKTDGKSMFTAEIPVGFVQSSINLCNNKQDCVSLTSPTCNRNYETA